MVFIHKFQSSVNVFYYVVDEPWQQGLYVIIVPISAYSPHCQGLSNLLHVISSDVREAYKQIQTRYFVVDKALEGSLNL